MGPLNAPPSKIRILIVDDQRLFRQSIRLLLERDPAFEVVGEAADGEEAIILAGETNPDLVLLDVGLPGPTGPTAARMIHERVPSAKILMLSVHNDDERIRQSLAAGATGYIFKGADYREFITILKEVTLGHSVSSPFLVTQGHEGVDAIGALTAREQEILKYLCQGMSNKEIAQTMSLSPETIKSRLQRIYSKLNINSRGEAMRLYYSASARISKSPPPPS